MSYRSVFSNVLTANVTEIISGQAATIDARGYTHLHVYPNTGGKVRWSSVQSATATSHGGDVQDGGVSNEASILVEAHFYRIEALNANVYVHPVFVNVGGLTILDDYSPLGLTTELNFVGDSIFISDLGGGRIVVRIGKATAIVYASASILIDSAASGEVTEDASYRAALAGEATEDVSIRIATASEVVTVASINIGLTDGLKTEDASMRTSVPGERVVGASILIEAPF